MDVTRRDLAVGAAALLAFPLIVNLTAWTAGPDGGRPLDEPLFQRGGAPAPTAGR